MTLEEREGGAGQGEGSGDPAAEAAGAAAAETGSGAESEGAEDARAAADRARDEHIARISADAARAAVREELSRFQPGPAAAAATPPTAGRSEYPELEAEAEAIRAEQERLNKALEAQGYTAENIVAETRLARRESRFLAAANLKATERAEGNRLASERDRAVKDAGAENEWRDYAKAHPGIPTDILRKAFLQEQREQAEALAARRGKKPVTRPGEERPVVDVSGASEVTASERKAKLMTQAQYDRALSEAEEKGDALEVAKLGRARRNKEILVKG